MRPLSHYERLLDTNPLLRLLLPFACGIGTGKMLHELTMIAPLPLFCGALLAALLALVTLRGYDRTVFPATFIVLLNISIALSGAAFFISATAPLDRPFPDDEVTAVGILTETPRTTPRTLQTNLRICSGELAGRNVRLSLLRADSLRAGDVLWFRCRLSPPRNNLNPGAFDEVAYLRRLGVSGRGFCPPDHYRRATPATATAVFEKLPAVTQLRIGALRLRDRLLRQYEARFSGRTLAVLSAITLGEKTRLDPETRSLFAETGTAHLLALSGLHLGILFALFRLFVLRHVRRRPLYVVASLLGIAFLWGFAFVAGLPVSLLRAALMFSLFQVASCLNRDHFPVNSLAFAALVILLFAPAALFDLSFQLSCLSVFSILLFRPFFPKLRGRLARQPLTTAYGMLTTTLSAQIGTLPLIAYVFHTLPTYGVVANLCVVPLSYPLLVGGFAFLLVPPLQPVTGFLLEKTFTLMETLLSALAGLPGSVVRWYPTLLSVVLCYLLLALWVSYHHRRRGRYVVAAACTLALLFGAEFHAHRPGHLPEQLIFYRTRSGPAVHYLVSDRHSYLWQADSLGQAPDIDYIRRTFWQREGIRRPHSWEPAAKSGLLTFAGTKIAVWNGPLSETSGPIRGGSGYLVVTQGATGTLSAALRHFRPEIVILDGLLPETTREQLRAEARKTGTSCHDTALDGALVIPLSR